VRIPISASVQARTSNRDSPEETLAVTFCPLEKNLDVVPVWSHETTPGGSFFLPARHNHIHQTFADGLFVPRGVNIRNQNEREFGKGRLQPSRLLLEPRGKVFDRFLAPDEYAGPLFGEGLFVDRHLVGIEAPVLQ